MRIRADFSIPATVPAGEQEWVRSPQPGVERVLLDRIGAEKARATSLVRYEAASRFPSHSHPGGEEIFVLSGVFSDEHGDYPEGFYLRNPPDSGHAPSSAQGTLIFVKLWQMHPADQKTVRLDTRDPANWVREHDRDVCRLHRFEEKAQTRQGVGSFNSNAKGNAKVNAKVNTKVNNSGSPHSWPEPYHEEVMLIRLRPGAALERNGCFDGGAEILVLDGSLRWSEAYVPGWSQSFSPELSKGAWLRIPPGTVDGPSGPGGPGEPSALIAGDQGATCYVKTGHLRKVLPDDLVSEPDALVRA